jgi:hypothetical protein
MNPRGKVNKGFVELGELARRMEDSVPHQVVE